MATVTIFAGLCGSGKSYDSKQLEQQYQARGEKVEMFDKILGRKEIPRLIQRLKDGVDCIVEEAFYCFRGQSAELVQRLNEQVPEAVIKWVCFENNLEAANANVDIRTSEIMGIEQRIEIVRLHKINQRLSENFECPEGCTPKPIHQRTP